MKLIRIFTVLLFLVLLSCNSLKRNQDPIESKRLTQQAFDLYIFEVELEATTRIDSALLLFDKAIKLDNKNATALEHKITVLFEQKRIGELISASKSLIKIKPNKPLYKLQKGMFLLAKGETSESTELFKKALIEYEDQLDGDLSDFDFNMEYINALTINNKFDKAQTHLNLMKEENYLEFQNQILKSYVIQVGARAKMIEYFNSDKTVDDMFQ